MRKKLLIPFYRTARIRHLYLKKRMKEMGLSGNMNMILLKLSERDACSQDELCGEVLADKASVSRDCAGLEKTGLIETKTDPENRRKSLVSLTDKGEQAAAEIRKVNEAIAAVLLRGLSEEDRIFLTRCLDVMEANAAGLWAELERK